MDRGAWRATVHGVVDESEATEHTDLPWAVTSRNGNNVCKVHTWHRTGAFAGSVIKQKGPSSRNVYEEVPRGRSTPKEGKGRKW